MSDLRRVLVTGGTGLLGGELKALLPDAIFPSHEEFDVTKFEEMDAFLQERNVAQLVHAAAFTSPPKIDADPMSALNANIIGTANVARLCHKHGVRLVYISTDYVFEGTRGNYKETDPVHPVNKYAWSKLGGECAVRMLEQFLIVRTSFGENEFPYEKAFVDQWTSRLPVREFAERLTRLIWSSESGVIHVGAPRRTILQYARAISPDKETGALSVHDVSFEVPKDTSLDIARYQSFLQDQGRERR